MPKKLVILPGDGIGPEIIKQAVKVIHVIEEKDKINFEINEALIGGDAIDKTGEPLPFETLKLCKESDAVLLGAVGGYKWDNLSGDKRPEAGLLAIRSGLGLYANLRPAIIFDALKQASPLKNEIIDSGIDILVVRELTGGIYFGKRGYSTREDNIRSAYDTEEYTEAEVRRIATIAFNMAMKRNKKLTSVDKANILESSRLWREVVTRMENEFPQVQVNYMYVDNCAMQLIKNPKQFDVILTSNMFGDILSDEASMITGSIGMLPSASLGESTLGLYEPIHGSAPDIEGKNMANPIATILSTAMMFRYSLKLEKQAAQIEQAVENVLNEGYRTVDIASKSDEIQIVGTEKMGDLIVGEINKF